MKSVGTAVNKPLASLMYREVLISDNIPNELRKVAEQRLLRLH
ncbi:MULTISPECIES: hypothetical protein [unclassified Pasteurella]